MAFAEAIDNLLHRDEAVADRHAAIAERITRVHAGDTATLWMEEVARTVREELDFSRRMAIRGLPEARIDLREVIGRAIKPPAVRKELATRMLTAFNRAVASLWRDEAPCPPRCLACRGYR